MIYRADGRQDLVCAMFVEPFYKFISQFNVANKPTLEQMATFIQLVFSQYPHYKPDHFKLFFIRALSGYYGKSFNRIDGPEIMNWLIKFDLDLDEEIMYERMREAGHYKQEAKQGPRAKAILQAAGIDYKTLVKNNRPKNEKGVLVEIKPREKSSTEELIQEWIREFDVEHRHKPVDCAIKMINYNGKLLDINGYLNERMTEYSSHSIDSDSINEKEEGEL